MASLYETGTKTDISEAPKVNWLKDRIQPVMMVKMPDQYVSDYRLNDPTYNVAEGDWLEFPLGIFILSTPSKKLINGQIYRDVEAYDGLVILGNDRFNSRYTIPAGTNYVDAVIEILRSAGITKFNIEQTNKTLATAMEYEPGTEKSKPIADLLAAINFTPLWHDENGYYTSSSYRSPQNRPIDVEYLMDEFSVVEDGMEEELDLFKVPNAWLVILTDPERPDLTSYIENNNPDSPTSYPSRGNQRIMEKVEVQDIADQQALDEYAQRISFEASQIFGKVTFNTALMPIHGYADVIYLNNDSLGIDGKFAETSWRMDLKEGGTMSHEVRAVVNIG